MIGEFKGQWNICLHGKEAGDYITDTNDVLEALEASGYRLTLEKIEALSEASDGIKMLQVALDRRDQFLVDNGHWDDFVGSLPLSPKEPDT